MDFAKEFLPRMEQQNLDLGIAGFLTTDDRVYPLGTDTKVLSTVFELFVRPVVVEIAGSFGMVVRQPDMQNFYPDFTLMVDEADPAKIAVDVKTTYRSFRKDGTWTASFTLGSYTSFLRKPTKNIDYPYETYARHFIIGFVYTRGEEVPKSHIYPLQLRHEIPSPFYDLDYFVQEKYRIAGQRPGSGNTTNIGSIVGSSISDFSSGNGPFAALGPAVFEDYWRNYGTTAGARDYRNLKEYLEWKHQKGGVGV